MEASAKYVTDSTAAKTRPAGVPAASLAAAPVNCTGVGVADAVVEELWESESVRALFDKGNGVHGDNLLWWGDAASATSAVSRKGG